MNAAQIDAIRLEVNNRLNQSSKLKFAQFMTPSIIADFMAGLFTPSQSKISRLLDCGAGIGSLALAVDRKKIGISHTDFWEIDSVMAHELEKNVRFASFTSDIHISDFIEDAVNNIHRYRYTHAILNPPYKKLNSRSKHRKLLNSIGLETVNLYSAFLGLTILQMQHLGQIVAIIPRSFCNGAYYKNFRKFILQHCAIEHIHIFESRKKVFHDDRVLQENIIIKLIKGKKQESVVVSSCKDSEFNGYSSNIFPFSQIVTEGNSENFIRIPNQSSINIPSAFKYNLTDIGLQASTGPIVDFRIKSLLEQNINNENIPLFYPHHFSKDGLIHPRQHKKPNAIKYTKDSEKYLLPNDGWYVIVKRFSAKEENKRINAFIINPEKIQHSFIGLENHLNFFHINKHGFDEFLAKGLICFLNSTWLDKYFREFSGHTQINITDLKNLPYPSLDILRSWGKKYHSDMSSEEINTFIQQYV